MESQRSAGSEIFRSIFGTISGGLSIFSNNPFRRTDERRDHAITSPTEGRSFGATQEAPSREEEITLMGSPSVEENFENRKKGELRREELITRYPEMGLERSRKRGRKTNEEKSTGGVEVDPLCHESTEGGELRKTEKKKKRENLIGEPLLHGKGPILEDKVNGEQGFEHQPGTPDGSDGTFSARKSKKEKRSHNELDRIEPRKRQRGSKAGSLEERDTIGFVGINLDNQGADSRVVTDSRGRKPDLARNVIKRKREDEIEARYEKRIRGSDSPPTNEKSSEGFYEKEEDKHKDGKSQTEAQAQELPSRKRKRSEDNGEVMNLRPFDDDEKLKRTIFVGNLSLKIKKKAIIKEFSEYGAVESVRLRSVPLLDTKIPRKGAIIKGKINEAVDSQHAYIVFKQEMSAKAAVAHNMKEFNGNHIRVDAAHAPSGVIKGKPLLSYDRTRSIFVGNVPFDVKDEELYQIFGTGKTTEMDIEAIRVVRDPQTSLSKGIAFILFKTKAGASHVLSSKRALKLRDRMLRVSRVLATQIEQKELRPAKRGRASDVEEGDLQKKRAKLSASYEGTRATKDGRSGKRTPRTLSKKNKIRPSKDNSNHPGLSHPTSKRQAAAAGKRLNETPETFSGSKRKRVEKRQRGISRSKKIRKS